MKKLITIIFLFIATLSYGQNRLYNLTTQFDSVKMRKLLLTQTTEGGVLDSLLVKKPNGGVFRVSRSALGSVSSFSFTNGGGFTGSVSNPTTTPALSLTLQDASASQSGQINTTTQTLSGNKTLTGSTTFGASSIYDATNVRLGIGTLTPSQQLHVEGSGAGGLFKRNSTNGVSSPFVIFTRTGATLTDDIVAGYTLGKFQFQGLLGGVATNYGLFSYLAASTTPGDGTFGFYKADLTTLIFSLNTNSGSVKFPLLSPSKALFLDGSSNATTAGPGTTSQYIRGDGSLATYAAGFTNPMTTQNDIIYGGASGVATRLAIGTSGQVLTSNGSSTAPSWQTPSGSASVSRLQSFYNSVIPGSSVADIYSYTVPGNSLVNNGAILSVSYEGVMTAGATYQFELFFAGTSLFSQGSTATTGTNDQISINFKIYKTGTSTAIVIGKVSTGTGAVTTQRISIGLAGLDFTTGNIVKIAGAGTLSSFAMNTGDIIAYQ